MIDNKRGKEEGVREWLTGENKEDQTGRCIGTYKVRVDRVKSPGR